MQKLLGILCLLFTTNCLSQGRIDSLKNVLKKDSSHADTYIRLCKEIRKTSAKDAEKYALRAMALAEKTDDLEIQDRALGEAGAVYYLLGDIPNASKYYNRRILVELKQKDSLNLILTYTFAAIIRRDSGNSPGALDLFLKAKKIADAYPDKKYKYGIYMSISEFYKDTDFEKAVAYLEEAHHAAKETNDASQISNVAFAMAQAELMKKNISKSKSYLRESLSMADKAGLPAMKSYVYAVYSNIFKTEKNYDSALYYRFKAVEVKLKTSDTNRLYDDYAAIGKIYLELRNNAQAIEYFNKGKDFATQVKSVNFLYDFGPDMAKAYSGMGNQKAAYQILVDHRVLKDSIMNSQRIKAIAEMQVKYEAEKKELENAKLKSDHTLQLQINQNQKVIFAGILAIALMGGLIYYFRAQAVKQKNIRLTEMVDAQNRELSTIALLVSKKNQSFTNLKSRLTDSLKNSTEEMASTLKSAIKEIDQEINFDEEWDTFKYHFEKVHPGFFTKLKEAAPALSDRELRFCAYLKSNLSTKEIARLTGATVRSVQQNKYRINQKFALAEGSLSEYLQRA